MKLRSIHLRGFKRFTDLRIDNLPATARLVMLTGPNGSGKSAIFEGFNWWRRKQGGFGQGNDQSYFPKQEHGATPIAVDVQFHDPQPPGQNEKRKAFWIRSAYRHEADFTSTALQRQASTLEDAGLDRLILADQSVRKNYERLASLGLQALFDPDNQKKTVGELQEDFVGPLRIAMSSVFDDLALRSLGNPVEDGTFFFDKGTSSKFHYKNLSAGEKSAFDLLLDLSIRRSTYDNTVFCIDEPEVHIGTRLQARLLKTLVSQLPSTCQLWLATHSVGMMRAAMDLHKENADQVAFLDTGDQDFDKPVTLSPVAPNRAFRRRHLEVALADIADLIAPSTLVLCEGADHHDGFDASCYAEIFREPMPDAEFMSIGSSTEVRNDRWGVATAVGVIAPGVQIIRVVDRDDATEPERNHSRDSGVQMLTLRNIESYLLHDEILDKLCNSNDQTSPRGTRQNPPVRNTSKPTSCGKRTSVCVTVQELEASDASRLAAVVLSSR